MSKAKERTKRVGRATKELFIGGRHFCCCIPTRFGVIAGSLLTFLFTAAFAIIAWFEVASEHDMSFTSQERTYVILAGLLETFVCLASIVGFIGGIVRKQLFVTIYAYFLYFNFLATLGVGIYFLWVVNHTADVDISFACNRTIKDPTAQKDCSKLLNDFRGLFDGIILFILLIELYGALIVTRYMRQLKREKRTARFANDEFRLKPHYYANLEGDDADAPDAASAYSYRPQTLSHSSATHFPTMPQGFKMPSPEAEKSEEKALGEKFEEKYTDA